MRRSTKAFINRARRIPGFSWFDVLHGYVYGGWPYLYIGWALNPPLRPLLRPLLTLIEGLIRRRGEAEVAHLSTSASVTHSGTIADTYHGKVVPLDAAKRLVQVDEPVDLTVPEHVVPFAVARDIVLEHPDHIVALDCPCRMAREDPCLPLDVCLIVGEPFASFVLEHQRAHARQITPDEAVEILAAEDARGHVHHAFFKDAMLQRFYAICNCCSCCCGAMQAHQNGIPMLISSGYVSEVDEARCVGCGTCVELCQFGALSLEDGHAVVDAAACMGCGVCTQACPQAALSLARAPDRPAPLEIEALSK